jgi:hypothetical protein
MKDFEHHPSNDFIILHVAATTGEPVAEGK